MKVNELDQVILCTENKRAGIQENSDSTLKKLVYQIPFN